MRTEVARGLEQAAGEGVEIEPFDKDIRAAYAAGDAVLIDQRHVRGLKELHVLLQDGEAVQVIAHVLVERVAVPGIAHAILDLALRELCAPATAHWLTITSCHKAASCQSL